MLILTYICILVKTCKCMCMLTSLKKGVKFSSLHEFKVWSSDYAIRNHKSYVVGHPTRRRIYETGQWVLQSCVATHNCRPPLSRHKGQRQLTSEYLRVQIYERNNMWSNREFEVSHMHDEKTIQIQSKVWEYMEGQGKHTVRMLYDDFEEVYNCLPRLLGANHMTPVLKKHVTSGCGVCEPEHTRASYMSRSVLLVIRCIDCPWHARGRPGIGKFTYR